jgi:nucleoside 2-deoxyribosyltransferase
VDYSRGEKSFNTVIYLASPYSHPSARVRLFRYRAVCRAAAALMDRGLLVFSPIAHSHGIALAGAGGDFKTWEKFDKEIIQQCSMVMVLKLEGWRESVGVREEVGFARKIGKPVCFLDPGRIAVQPGQRPVPSKRRNEKHR